MKKYTRQRIILDLVENIGGMIVCEEKVEEYTTVVKGSDVINTHTPGKTSVQVTKAWKDNNYEVIDKIIIPDDQATIEEKLKYASDVLGANLILTTGGTGFSKRDVTPVVKIKLAPKTSLAYFNFSSIVA